MPTAQRPMPTLEVNSEQFTTEWRRCWENPAYDMSYLVQIATPFIVYWESLLTKPGPKDINYVSLCSLLSHNQNQAVSDISKWIEYAEQTTTLREELIMIFVEHVRTANYYPTFASARNSEFVIARDYKLRIKLAIQQSRTEEIDYCRNATSLDQLATADYHPDHLLIKNMGLDQWESYLLSWFKTGRATFDIAKTIHVPTETLKREEKYLWDYLKQNYYKAEV
jgi:hypothetical protein